ncbi:Hsp20/alpha crystallin family protein [Ancylostoma caninum]|uniref:Hsp20/alpha crystallin family protein n=1 Tax=Ancylostoma caninum TaxID=29170 RepID=A0A368FII8_ANCCA|nr:Hsp20/alpha crystallin family protein [Ancylostoma caninum]
MSLWPHHHHHRGPFGDFLDFNRFEREMFPFSDRPRFFQPYWMDADHSVLHVANQTQEDEELISCMFFFLCFAEIVFFYYLDSVENRLFAKGVELAPSCARYDTIIGTEPVMVVNDNKKFAVALDVSQFKPEEISVHLQDRDLIIEGKQEHKDDKGYMQRSFVRKWTLPPDVDLEAVRTHLTDVVNDNKKFAVALDVSQFKPEEISVHLQDRDLIIEGKQEHKDDKGYMQRSFVRKWTLPPDVDLEAVRTQLTDVGHLSVEAPKTGHGVKSREIPIMPAPRKN